MAHGAKGQVRRESDVRIQSREAEWGAVEAGAGKQGERGLFVSAFKCMAVEGNRPRPNWVRTK